MRCFVNRLNVESLEERDVMSVGVLPPTADGFTPPIGSNKGSIMGDGFGIPWSFLVAGQQAPPASGICAVWHD